MANIYDFDMRIHVEYAQRTLFVEQVDKTLQLRSADAVASQVQIVDVYPRQSELDLLLGYAPRHPPWALFYPPDELNYLRTTPFAFSQVAPSLGSPEKLQADMQKLAGLKCNTNEEKFERAALTSCAQALGEINDSIGFVVGRVGQFLQG